MGFLFPSLRLLLPLLLLLLLPVGAECSLKIINSSEKLQLQCQNAATDVCIAQLTQEELLPLQCSIANGSELLTAIDQQFVACVWAYVGDSIKEPITASDSELMVLSRTLSHFYVTWNSTQQKANALRSNLIMTHTEVRAVGGGVRLLEEVRVALQQTIALLITQTREQLQESEDLLGSFQMTLTELISMESEFNAILRQLSTSSASLVQQTFNIFQVSLAVTLLRNSVADTLAMVLEQMETAEVSDHAARNVIPDKVCQLDNGLERLRDTLEQLNGMSGQGIQTVNRAMETVLDVLRVADDLYSSVVLRLHEVQGVVTETNTSILAVSQHIQNASLAVAESAGLVSEHAVFKARVLTLEAGAGRTVEHALDLSQQVQSITEFLSEEFLDETERLRLINTTASRAVAISDYINKEMLNASELLDSAAHADVSARRVLRSVQNITTASASVLDSVVGTLDSRVAQYGQLNTAYLATSQEVNSAEHQVSVIQDELSALMKQLDRIQNSRESDNEIITGVSSLLSEIDVENVTSEIRDLTSNASDCLDQVTANTSLINTTQLSLSAQLLNLSQCLQEAADTQSQLSGVLDRAFSVVSASYTLLHQAEVPLEFGDNNLTTRVIAVNEEQLSSAVASGEFRSLSFQFSPDNTNSTVIHLISRHNNQFSPDNTNSTVIHLISRHNNQASSELSAVVFDAQLRVLFKATTSRGREFSLALTLSEVALEPQKSYAVVISRTGSNSHVQLTDHLSSETHFVSGEASDRLVDFFSSSSFFTSATLHVGGAALQPMMEQNEEISSSYFSGCLGNVVLNGEYLNLWSLATDTGQLDLHTCSRSTGATSESSRVGLSFSGDQFSLEQVNRSILPLLVEFQTQFPNGLLLHTHSNSTQSVRNSFTVYLDLGRIEVRVDAGNRHRTLTTSQTYNTGSPHTVSMELDGSRLVLRTAREVVRKRLQVVPVESLSTYSELLVGGVGSRVREEEDVEQSNFTGCVTVVSSGSVLKVPKCFGQKVDGAYDCTYCSVHEPVFSADFYGASYAVFPAFVAAEHLDISFHFRTNFEDGLLMFIGSASDSMWLALSLMGSRFYLLLQASSNTPYGFPIGARLSDGIMHSVVIVRSGDSFSMTVDSNTLEYPGFGSFLPVGRFPSDLFVGGISKLQRDLLFVGVPRDGYRGYLGGVHINGRVLDFSENVDSEAVTFFWPSEDDNNHGQNRCEFHFTESSYAEFDLGRFADSFSLGVQFNTEAESGLLFYVFSRRREDKMAVQLNQSRLQLYIEESASGSEWLVSVSQEVAPREWHDVRIGRQGGNITVVLDGNIDLEEQIVLPSPLRTTSLLYIGGLPSDQHIPTSDSIITENFSGCLRTHYLSLATLHGVDRGCCATVTP